MKEMRSGRKTEPCAQLKELIAEATGALTLLDASRLEELARTCQLLNRPLSEMKTAEREELASQSRAATRGMVVFDRVLAATRANLRVLNVLEETRADKLEYTSGLGVNRG